MSDRLRHLFRLRCFQMVAGHEFVPAAHPGWAGFRGCTWIANPQADICYLPRRCHSDLRGRP